MSGTTLTERRRSHRKDYTDQEREAALRAFAICSGHRARASELLKQQGIEIPEETIRYWAQKSHRETYVKIRAEVADQLREQMADVQQSLAMGAAEIEAQAIERLGARLKNDENPVEDKDLANILKNAAIATGVHVDKAQLLEGQPTQIVKRSASEVLRKLASKGVVIDAEVVEETTVEEIESSA